jgi:hypothetical protein
MTTVKGSEVMLPELPEGREQTVWQGTKSIPVEGAKHIAEAFGYDQVVVIARKVGHGEHVTTYGVNKAHCGVAARIGDFLKYEIMQWERTQPVPEAESGQLDSKE